jgi:hypothetical protein
MIETGAFERGVLFEVAFSALVLKGLYCTVAVLADIERLHVDVACYHRRIC